MPKQKIKQVKSDYLGAYISIRIKVCRYGATANFRCFKLTSADLNLR
jgi:hypothetical protein